MSEATVNRIKVRVPHRISGFFQMQDPQQSAVITDPLQIGSRGGGPALTAYGETIVTLIPKIGEKHFIIHINGVDHSTTAKTSLSTLQMMQPYLPVEMFQDRTLVIDHKFDLPMGAGYGSSGAGALGIAFGFNELFQLGFTPLQAAKFAHIAEVTNHTGLGTVGGQFTGGMSILVNPGYPFDVHQISVPSDLMIAVASWGSISTKAILTDPVYKQLIFEKGRNAMHQMQQEWTLENYMQVCHTFLHETQLLHNLKLEILTKIIEELNQKTRLGASMNQLGQSIFCFCENNEKQQVSDIMTQYSPKYPVQFLQVEKHGPTVEIMIDNQD